MSLHQRHATCRSRSASGCFTAMRSSVLAARTVIAALLPVLQGTQTHAQQVSEGTL